jgi:hypothetical protein
VAREIPPPLLRSLSDELCAARVIRAGEDARPDEGNSRAHALPYGIAIPPSGDATYRANSYIGALLGC